MGPPIFGGGPESHSGGWPPPYRRNDAGGPPTPAISTLDGPNRKFALRTSDHCLTTPRKTAWVQAVSREPQPVSLRRIRVSQASCQRRSWRWLSPCRAASPACRRFASSDRPAHARAARGLRVPATRWSVDGRRSCQQLGGEFIDVTLTSRSLRRPAVALARDRQRHRMGPIPGGAAPLGRVLAPVGATRTIFGRL
jgi:hypothetical protein